MSSTSSFQTVLGFTSDDLANNRRGQLSEAQITSLKKADRASSLGCLAIFGFFFVFAAGMLVVFSSAFFTKSNGISGMNAGALAGLAVPGIFCVVLGLLILATLRSLLFPKTPTLGRVSGVVVLGNRTSDSKSYEIEINGRSFKVSQPAYQLLDASKTYTVYTAVYDKDDSDRIVAIEEGNPGGVMDAAANKSPQEYEKEQLQRIFNFTDADFATNRVGQLSADQSARLSKNIGNGIGCGIFMGIVVGIFPLTFISGFTQNITLAVAVTAGAFLLVLVLSMMNASHQQRALAEANVQMLRGAASVRISKVHHSGKNSYTETIYHVQIGETEFRVPEETYYAFKEGQQYTVYYVPSLDSTPIVSAEQIS